MGWTLAIAMLALNLEATPFILLQTDANDAKISDQVNCAASFLDGRWKSRSIRQFQAFRRRIHNVVGSAIGPAADDRFFVFGENATTTIFFVSMDECTKATKKLDSAKLFPKRGKLLSTDDARARWKVVFQEK